MTVISADYQTSLLKTFNIQKSQVTTGNLSINSYWVNLNKNELYMNLTYIFTDNTKESAFRQNKMKIVVMQKLFLYRPEETDSDFNHTEGKEIQ